MNIESHKRNLKESLESLKECVERGIEDRQRSIGFHTSAAMCDMLEMLLHKKSLIDPGASIKHDWFSSTRTTQEKLNFDFPNKKEILEIMVRIENKRNILCYGKRQSEKVIRSVIDDFNFFMLKIKEAGLDEL
ncbi:MAG: hypothetical protein HYT73_02475 [Candidatus Aenigmarchaeota archaeon]|nr:hypothetical protein [Candidatus Aenigmarchaeota archaeon]